MSDVSLTHSEQYRLENFLEQISGQLAADIAHCQRNGEFDLAEMKLLTQSLAASIRKMLSDKGMMKRDLIVPQCAREVGQEAVHAELTADPIDRMVAAYEGEA